jgi:hypothetical protein
MVNSSTKGFCSGCYYLICIRATKSTEGSIVIGSESSKFTLSENKVLVDELLNKGSTTYLNFYRVSGGQVVVNVHSGKIKV